MNPGTWFKYFWFELLISKIIKPWSIILLDSTQANTYAWELSVGVLSTYNFASTFGLSWPHFDASTMPQKNGNEKQNTICFEYCYILTFSAFQGRKPFLNVLTVFFNISFMILVKLQIFFKLHIFIVQLHWHFSIKIFQ